MNIKSTSDFQYSPLGVGGSSRDKILAMVKQNQPAAAILPSVINYDQHYEDIVAKFMEMLRFIGGDVHLVNNYEEIESILKGNFREAKKVLSTCTELADIADIHFTVNEPHELADVDLFVTTSDLAVAENGAVWLTHQQDVARVLPFITQQLAVVIKKENIVATMHDAYDAIGEKDYGHAVFVAGPSKTADIEQSLVLGAHGAKTMTVFIL